jgi:enoyl-CoA hydratase/carnithine racemase
MSEVREEQRGAARWIVIDRAAQRNALSPQTIRELCTAFERADEDASVRVVCLTGAGDKSFCAGADLGSLGEALAAGPMAAHEGRRSYVKLLTALARMGKPVVACVNGAALAGGMGLLAACDLAVAADDARFGAPEADIGLFPYMALAPLSRVLPRRIAMELVLTARKIDAGEALRIGLLNLVVPRAELQEKTQMLLDELARKSPTALRLGRRAFYSTQDLPYEAQLEALCSLLSLNASSEDTAEGLGAFLEKRAPNFPGR